MLHVFTSLNDGNTTSNVLAKNRGKSWFGVLVKVKNFSTKLSAPPTLTAATSTTGVAMIPNWPLSSRYLWSQTLSANFSGARIDEVFSFQITQPSEMRLPDQKSQAQMCAKCHPKRKNKQRLTLFIDTLPKSFWEPAASQSGHVKLGSLFKPQEMTPFNICYNTITTLSKVDTEYHFGIPRSSNRAGSGSFKHLQRRKLTFMRKSIWSEIRGTIGPKTLTKERAADKLYGNQHKAPAGRPGTKHHTCLYSDFNHSRSLKREWTTVCKCPQRATIIQ